MYIEGFDEIAHTLMLAKLLYDIGRFDIVQSQFFNSLSYYSCLENMLGAIDSVFSWFYSDYDSGNEIECMIFMDDLISDYFCYAWEYGRTHKVPQTQNPYVIEAENEARRLLSFTYNMEWRLLGYTKSKRAARKSKLVVRNYACEFYEHDHLALGLVQLYKWFADRCLEIKNQRGATAA